MNSIKSCPVADNVKSQLAQGCSRLDREARAENFERYILERSFISQSS